MMAQLYQESVEKEDALVKLQVAIQNTKEAQAPSIANAEANTMIETSMVTSPFKEFSQYVLEEPFGNFGKHNRGISSKLIRKMGYNGQGLCKRSHRIVNPTVTEHRARHEVLGFGGKE